METVARREWVIRALDGAAVTLEQHPGGETARLRRDLLPDDVAVGDRFRVLAQVDRRSDEEAPAMPAALDEALENLTSG